MAEIGRRLSHFGALNHLKNSCCFLALETHTTLLCPLCSIFHNENPRGHTFRNAHANALSALERVCIVCASKSLLLAVSFDFSQALLCNATFVVGCFPGATASDTAAGPRPRGV